MDEDGLPIVGPGVDLTKVEAIHQKRMLAFLNHFITHTVRFLNKFSCVCEEKLGNLYIRIQRLETTLNILEAKIASIPGPRKCHSINKNPVVTSSSNPISQDPRYATYFKMLNIGIHPQAVKQKMSVDGVDPNLLDTPNAPAPPADAADSSESDFSEDDTQSSFSDD
ncbi:WASH complex subunit 3-like [Saccoglossus kowalevskii]